jgi:hypothetical protein
VLTLNFALHDTLARITPRLRTTRQTAHPEPALTVQHDHFYWLSVGRRVAFNAPAERSLVQ